MVIVCGLFLTKKTDVLKIAWMVKYIKKINTMVFQRLNVTHNDRSRIYFCRCFFIKTGSEPNFSLFSDDKVNLPVLM